MELELTIAAPRQHRWGILVAAAALLVVVGAALALRSTGAKSLDRAVSPVAAAAQPAVHVTPPSAPIAEAVTPAAQQDPKPSESVQTARPAAPAPPQGRPKSRTAPKPVKPVYTRD
jgi:hypothetical protein